VSHVIDEQATTIQELFSRLRHTLKFHVHDCPQDSMSISAARGNDAAVEDPCLHKISAWTVGNLGAFGRAFDGIMVAMSDPCINFKEAAMSETPRILIVDDDDEIRSILRDFLSRQYSCETLDCAQQALTSLARGRFDLVISDIAMPGMTGLEMIPHMKHIAPDAVIVMISGQRMIESAVAAMRAGALDYITKPFELNQVDDVVRRALVRQSGGVNFARAIDRVKRRQKH
jgi:CheY-like chemotaxis protein